MKKFALLVSFVAISSVVTADDAVTFSFSLPSVPAFIKEAPANLDNAIRNNPYYAMFFAAVAAVVATKAVDAYLANNELDEEYEF
ncbi:MAG TPA: hypothetical protein VLG50_04015 [Candidatus Saccharimonadales bacterium]|nr:hypothetical protein [Candidatus Saccharimonadales bacterium]